MNTRAFLALLIFAQLACIAFGLGFHYVYIRSSLDHTAHEEAKSVLSEQARRLSSELTAANITSAKDLKRRAASAPARQKAAEILAIPGPTSERVFVVDADWHTVLDPLAGNSDEPVAQLEWVRPASAPQHAADDPVHGLVQSAGGPRYGAAHPLASHDGYVVAESDLAGVKVAPATLDWHLRTGAAISLLWMAGLMTVSAYMIVSYFNEGHKQRNSPDVDALKQTQALVRTQETVIFALAKLSDSRDPDTGDHLERISYYSSTLASALRQHPEFRDVVTPGLVRLIGISSALHDIGKVGVEDSILKKPGTLTPAERTRMQRHTRVGEDCLKEIERRLGTSNFLQMAREIASAHHERWDGTGYPLGLAGEQIPVAARIVAIADVYDALSSKRVYKEALPHEQCVALILQEAGKHFDPRLVEVFGRIEPSFRLISRQFAAGKEEASESQTFDEVKGHDETQDTDSLLSPAGSNR